MSCVAGNIMAEHYRGQGNASHTIIRHGHLLWFSLIRQPIRRNHSDRKDKADSTQATNNHTIAQAQHTRGTD
jgi:hypothetical protein